MSADSLTVATYVASFDTLTIEDVPRVGGKNASLGEMIRELAGAGIRVPTGFATTAHAYWRFMDHNNLREPIEADLAAYKSGRLTLARAGRSIRGIIRKAEIPADLRDAILHAYHDLGAHEENSHLSVAVRSSATAEDLPEASFAGQQETFLNIEGDDELVEACRDCYASLFTDRAITYRDNNGFDHMKVALSIGVQRMVRSDKGAAGVMFTLDTETGFPHAIMINAAWGLGENVVKGTVNPDEYYVFKPPLHDKTKKPILRKTLGAKERRMVFARGGRQTTRNVNTTPRERERFALEDTEILQLADWAMIIERHYSARRGENVPMDIEWALDGENGKLYIVQARPETVQRNRAAGMLVSYVLEEKSEVLVKGRSVGEAIAVGPVCVVDKPSQIAKFKPGSILVAEMTDPDWVPILRQAAGIVTDHGGRTCHAAIVSRELGIPAVVGTGNGTEVLKDGQPVTISCAEGQEARVYAGALKFRREEVQVGDLPPAKVGIMMNLADPASAFQWWRMPCDGIGLARMEFIITNDVRVHPMALVKFDEIADPGVRAQIGEIARHYSDKKRFFVETLARGVATIAASQYPRPVIVRMSDFKTNEYAGLVGGAQFEPKEENPMIGFRGASRYYSEAYRAGFALECHAMRYAREVIGLDNIVLMIPFCRTLEEADRVLEVMAAEGLRRGENGLKIYVMCEIPSNVILAKEFAARFDGFSIGSNDLTQLTLGVDRDSAELASLFDERNPAVKQMIRDVITRAHEAGSHVGICGQAPSDYPDFCDFLVEAGIDSISLNPDSVISVRRRLAQ